MKNCQSFRNDNENIGQQTTSTEIKQEATDPLSFSTEKMLLFKDAPKKHTALSLSVSNFWQHKQLCQRKYMYNGGIHWK